MQLSLIVRQASRAVVIRAGCLPQAQLNLHIHQARLGPGIIAYNGRKIIENRLFIVYIIVVDYIDFLGNDA